VNALSLEALRSRAKVIAFTAHKTAPLPYVDYAIRISAQTLPPCMPTLCKKLVGTNSDYVSSLPEGGISVMQMGSSFELALSIVLESLCIVLEKRISRSQNESLSQSSIMG